MTPENFCYWLQGFFEINGRLEEPLTIEQCVMIKEHLQLAFKKETSVPVQSLTRSPLEEFLKSPSLPPYTVTC